MYDITYCYLLSDFDIILQRIFLIINIIKIIIPTYVIAIMASPTFGFAIPQMKIPQKATTIIIGNNLFISYFICNRFYTDAF